MSVAAARTNPLSFLTDQLDELKAKGTHFKLRVLEDEQAASAHLMARRSSISLRTIILG